ncbi:MAG: CvpA family protein [Dysgonamonadaceae bacterium]|jgi:membrane protein required for colicin V production|nr:CvpA family protein [Dysgonamonadaceae bacterium]
MDLNRIDIIILICVLIGSIKGLFDGIINQAVALFALAGGILFAGLLAKPIKELFLLLPEKTLSMNIIDGLSYVSAFAAIMTGILLLGKIVSIVVNLTPIAVLNKLTGFIAGGFLWILLLSLILNLTATFDTRSTLITKEAQQHSRFYEPVKAVVPTIYPFIKDYFNK